MKNKLKNYLKRALRFPQEIHLESHSGCNSSCTICPRQDMTRYQGDMARELFLKAVRETKGKQLKYIHFHLNGEPMLMDIDELCWRINFAREMNPIENEKGEPKLCFFTNGSLLTEYRADMVLDSELDIIVISIDGGNKQDYEKIRLGLNFEIVIDNVRNLVEKRNKSGKKLWIQTAIIPQRDNQNSISEYFRLFGKEICVDDCGGSGVQNIGGLIKNADELILKDQYMGGNINAPCWRVFLDLSICADGKAVTCCQDVRAMGVIGDLNEETVEEIWHGERMTQIRDNFVYGRKSVIPFCKDCDYMRSFVAPDFWKVNSQDFREAYKKALEESGIYANSKN